MQKGFNLQYRHCLISHIKSFLVEYKTSDLHWIMRAIGNTLCFSLYFLLMHFLTDKDRRGRLKSTADVGRIDYLLLQKKVVPGINQKAKQNTTPKTKQMLLICSLAIQYLFFYFCVRLCHKLWILRKYLLQNIAMSGSLIVLLTLVRK